VVIKGEWGYNIINGPSTWHYTYPLCAGEHQSPIEIITRAVEDDDSVGNISLNNYDLVRNASLVNNGHTISFQLGVEASLTPNISGGHLQDKKFIFQQAHWHWSTLSHRGSEHHIDGVKDPMELHLVHMNTKYPNLTEAFNHTDGVAVLALLYKVSEDDNMDIQPIVTALTNMNKKQREDNTTENICVDLPEAMKVSQLFPSNLFEQGYYYYQGSLTTPSCSESVTWAVFPNKINISESQLEVFRNASFNGDKLSDNYRPVQELNGRIVKRAGKNHASRINFDIAIIALILGYFSI